MLYFDNGATTKPDKVAIDAINNVLVNDWGNPSSLHNMGVMAEQAVIKARNQIAKSLKTNAKNIYFTPSGSFSDNIAIFGTCEANKRKGKRIITTAIEHSAVYNCFKQLEQQGYDVVYLDELKDTQSIVNQVLDKVNDETILVSIMHVNNEIGLIYDVEQISAQIKKKNKNIIFHTDAVQSYMKLPIDLNRSNIDLLSISAHKVHGPKGIGALYIKENTRINPMIFGGNQEKGMVSGTENVAAISGFGAVAEKFYLSVNSNFQKAKERSDYLKEKLRKIDCATIFSPEDASPYIVSVGFKGIRSEIMLHFLETYEIYVSSGSACSKGKKSRVLSVYGVNDSDADTAIRISMEYATTTQDIDELCDAIERGTKTIMRS